MREYAWQQAAMQNGGGGTEDNAFKLACQPTRGTLLADREHDNQSAGLKGQQVADQGVELVRREVRGAAVAVGGVVLHEHLAQGGGGAVVEVGGGAPDLG